MEAQMQIRQEAQEKQEVLQDLLRWAPETQKRPGDKTFTSIRPAGPALPGTQEGIAPLRSSRGNTADQQRTQALNTLRESVKVPTQSSNGSAASHTYDKFSSKWDKFDYESALADADDENSRQKQSFSFPKGSKPAKAPPRVSRAQPGGEPRQQNLPASQAEPTDAELWKDRGNKAFSAKNYAQAKKDYTQSIALQPTCLAYANRAMAHLKLEEYSAAEADCTKAIALDATYVKAFLRRASAAQQLGKLLEATEDFEHALRLEPTSKTTLTDRQACLEQLLQQEGLQDQLHRVALPIRQAAKSSAQATSTASSSSAQPQIGISTPPSTSQATSSKAQHTKSQPAQSELRQPSTSQQQSATSSMPSADRSAEALRQSTASPAQRELAGSMSQQKLGSSSQQPNGTSHMPFAGVHTGSRYGMAAQRRRAEPSVVIEELPPDKEDVPTASITGGRTSQADIPSSSNVKVQPASSPSAARPQPPPPAAAASSTPSTSKAASSDPVTLNTSPIAKPPATAPAASLPSAQAAVPSSRNQSADRQAADASTAAHPEPAAASQSTSPEPSSAEAVSPQAALPSTAPEQAAAAQTASSDSTVGASSQTSTFAATSQPASQHPDSLMFGSPSTDKATPGQADPAGMQKSNSHAAVPDASLQSNTALEPPAKQLGKAEPAQQAAMLANGKAHTSSHPQSSGASASETGVKAALASKEQRLQAAAVTSTSAKSQAAVSAGLSLPTPRSGTEFEVSWKRLKGNAAGQEEFLRQLDPMQLPALFKQSLAAPMLSGIALAALNMIMAQNDHFGIQLLENLKSVPRFDMIVMSLPRREKSALKEHYDAAQTAPVTDSVLANRLSTVRRSFRV